MNIDTLVKSAMMSFFMLAASGQAIAEESSPATEKCYGVVKAGMNDCATATASCAGSATKDNQSDAFILLPQGVCDKLAGGSLKLDNKKISK